MGELKKIIIHQRIIDQMKEDERDLQKRLGERAKQEEKLW